MADRRNPREAMRRASQEKDRAATTGDWGAFTRARRALERAQRAWWAQGGER